LRFIAALVLLCIFQIYAGTLLPVNAESAPVIVLSPGTGRIGSEIEISGSGFLPTDTTCAFSSPSSAALVTSAACVTQGGSLWGGFVVGNVMLGAYVIEATGNQGDIAQALLQVTGGAQVGLTPATDQPGADVSVRGVGFLPTDTTCSISSPSSPNVVLTGTAACVIQSGMAYGGFIVGNVLPGEYVVQLTGNQGDSAQAILTIE
jgi:hypothetical protein